MKRLALPILALSLAAGACGDDLADANPDAGPAADAAQGPQAVTINFEGKVGTMDAACGATYENLGVDSDESVEIKDLRFYVSNVRLINDASEEVAVELDQSSPFQTSNVALLDFEDGTALCVMGTTETNSTVTGTVPPGTYSGIVFDVAVPFDLNHLDLTALSSPLNISTMYWAWAIGHKFIRVDLDVLGPGNQRTPWNVHLGSQACGVMGQTPPTAECGLPNRPEISIAGFDPAADSVVFDLAPLIADSELRDNAGMAPGCQSFAADATDCTPLFPNLGIDYTTGDCINGCADQVTFRME